MFTGAGLFFYNADVSTKEKQIISDSIVIKTHVSQLG
jgi:hypothetical protein